MTQEYYHLGTAVRDPMVACGGGAKLRGGISWDWWEAWSKRERSSQGYPRCPACLESDYYAFCLLGELP